MENPNHVHVYADLGTEQGRKIVAAVAAVLAGGVATASVETKAPVAEKAAPAPAKKVAAKPAPKVVAEETEEEPETGEDEVAEEEAPAAKPAPKAVAKPAAKVAAAPAAKPAAKPAPAKPAPKAAAKPVAFEDLDEEAQLEALKAHATKHTKKGKTADIKALVANYGAERVSDLDPEYYVEFNDVLTRYSDGESVEDIFPNVD